METVNAEVYDLVLGDENEEEWSPVKAAFAVWGGVDHLLMVKEKSGGPQKTKENQWNFDVFSFGR